MAWTEKYVTDAGAGAADGSSLANAWSWATMLTTLAAGERANYNGAITRTTSTDAFTNPGTAANPIALRSCDGSGNPIVPTRAAGAALDMTGVGVITYTTGRLTLPAFMETSGISVTSAAAGNTVTVTNSGSLYKSNIVNTNASHASARAISATAGDSVEIVDCDATIASSSSSAVAVSLGNAGMVGSRVSCGSAGSSGVTLSTRAILVNTAIINCATGANATGSGCFGIINCSFRNCSVAAIGVANDTMCPIINCVVWGAAGSSVWFAGATSIRPNFQLYNAVGNMGGADTNEGNWTTTGQISLTADPFTSSTDLSLNNTSGGGALCFQAGLNGADLGAWPVDIPTPEEVAAAMWNDTTSPNRTLT